MSCPHSVLECVEFAERDSFLDTPNAYHHINGFDIVGFVVLRVVYLFHIPYQIFCAKIEKTLHISQRGGMDSNQKKVNILCQRCKYSDNLWKIKSPVHSRTGRGTRHTILIFTPLVVFEMVLG